MIPRDTELIMALVLGMIAVLVSGVSRTQPIQPVKLATMEQVSVNRAVVEAVKADMRRAREILTKIKKGQQDGQ